MSTHDAFAELVEGSTVHELVTNARTTSSGCSAATDRVQFTNSSAACGTNLVTHVPSHTPCIVL